MPAEGTQLIADGLNPEPFKNSPSARVSRLQLQNGPQPEGLQLFSKAFPLRPYSVQLQYPVTASVSSGDTLFLSVWVRAISTADESGEVQNEFVFEGTSDPRNSLQSGKLGTGKSWKHYTIPFQATTGFKSGTAHLTMRFGYAEQTLEIAILSLLNYGTSKTPQDLPVTHYNYNGRELDAPWRIEAQKRTTIK